MNPPVLVTGGAGYIDSHVVLALRDCGWPVVVLDNLLTGLAEAVPADVPLVCGSTANGALVRCTLRQRAIGAVTHLAGSLVVGKSVTWPLA